MTTFHLKYSPFKSIFTHIRPQSHIQCIITLCILIKMRIPGLGTYISEFIVFTFFVTDSKTKQQSCWNIFCPSEIINQIRLIIFYFSISKSTKIIQSVVIQMICIITDNRTIIKQSCKKTGSDIHILVITIPKRQLK